MTPPFHRIVIIGMGQIGTSLGLDLVQSRLAREVIGIGRTQTNLLQALRLKAAHRVFAASAGAGLMKKLTAEDLVILAAPVSSIREWLSRLPKHVLTIDVGSTKSSILTEADRRGLRFLGCHPIAGTEKGGAEAGRAGLFKGKTCFLVAGRRTSADDIKTVSNLWKHMGSQVEMMDAASHDRIFAASSHLPHAAAYALIQATARKLNAGDLAKFAYTSLKDTTRIALSPPEMWKTIFAENAGEVLKGIQDYQKELGRLASKIRTGHGLLSYLNAARRSRLILEK